VVEESVKVVVRSETKDESAKKEAFVESICNSLLSELLSDTSRLFSKSNKVGTTVKSAVDKKTAESSSSQIPRTDKGSDRTSVSPRSGSRLIQDMMLTTFDLGSDTSEGKEQLCLIYSRHSIKGRSLIT
jgi:hypothetical protein